MIDPHVHLRDWAQREKETLAHGLAVAQACGITALFDMPNTNPPLTDRATIERRLMEVAALKAGVSYHLWAGVTSKRNQVAEVAALAMDLYPAVVGLKLFAGHSTGNMGLTEEEGQLQVYRWLAEAGYDGVVALHCEKEQFMHPELNDPNDFSSHSRVRPPEAEVASVADQIRLSRQAGFEGHLHICHLSTMGALEQVEQARREGRRISCAVTPHHLLLSEEDAKRRSLWAKMNPPLRSQEERSALFTATLDARVDWIETDHAPHTLTDKEGGASGIPGFSGLLLAIKALIDAGIDETLLSELAGGRVKRLFALEQVKVTIPPYDALCAISDRMARQYPYDSFAGLRARSSRSLPPSPRWSE
ncbi:MAG: dihydroorotase family protein [Sphaerochaeta sp.]|nr:dihydroorotase family protein [Sphaerochaeta sp.]